MLTTVPREVFDLDPIKLFRRGFGPGIDGDDVIHAGGSFSNFNCVLFGVYRLWWTGPAGLGMVFARNVETRPRSSRLAGNEGELKCGTLSGGPVYYRLRK